MSFIRVVPSEEADPALRHAYDAVRNRRGAVANIIGIHSVHPEVMTAHVALYEEIMFSRSELRRSPRTRTPHRSARGRAHSWTSPSS